jgi:hypothetical protein
VLWANKLASAPRAETGSSVARISGRPAILPLRAPVSGRTGDEVVDRTSTLDTFKTGKFCKCNAPLKALPPFHPTLFRSSAPAPNQTLDPFPNSTTCGLDNCTRSRGAFYNSPKLLEAFHSRGETKVEPPWSCNDILRHAGALTIITDCTLMTHIQ